MSGSLQTSELAGAERPDLHESFARFLAKAVDLEASDLHMVVGHKPTCRIHGRLQSIDDQVMDEDSLKSMLMPLCPDSLREKFLATNDIDFSYTKEIDGTERRFRVNYFFNLQQVGACLRLIPSGIPTFAWAGFPEVIANRLVRMHNGLVLVTGVTGSGKTTTLAMIINLLNQEGGHRIITVEEPVEYLFPKCDHSIVTQREVGIDVSSFFTGLKYGLRQDPDVMLVGEIRDRETAQMALTAAETGHLVFATMHTRDAKGAITRYADLFPQEAQDDVRSQLAMSLRAVISQHLLPSAQAGGKRVLGLEVMFNSLPVASAIRFNKIESISNCILTGKADGMINLDESLRLLLKTQQITKEVARKYSNDPEAFR